MRGKFVHINLNIKDYLQIYWNGKMIDMDPYLQQQKPYMILKLKYQKRKKNIHWQENKQHLKLKLTLQPKDKQ